MPFSTAHPSLLAALTDKGYASPTPVQAAILAEGVADRDLLVSAQTGSGKTVAFGLAMASNLLGDKPTFGKAGAPMALVVCPTRELALQVQRELAWLYAKAGVRITTCVGGMDIRREQFALSQGVHIVVGTPGRLTDHLERGKLDLTKLAAVVLDEADEMLDMGFREDLENLLKTANPARRTLLFSATIPKEIAELAKRFQKNAQRIATTSDKEVHRDIEYKALVVVPREKERAVVNILRYHEANGALVFCATREAVTRLTASLQERGFACVALSGELSQRERTSALQALRDRRAKVCVATDVAARGLDLPDLGLVIHGDLPQNKEVMLHRSGRTGRAGKKGISIMLVQEPARRYAERMLKLAHIDAVWGLPPTAEEIRAIDEQRIAAQLDPMFAELTEEDKTMATSLVEQHTAVELAAALMRLQREQLPSAEELTTPPSMRTGRAARDDRDVRGSRTERPGLRGNARFDEAPRGRFGDAKDAGARGRGRFADAGPAAPRSRFASPDEPAPRRAPRAAASEGSEGSVWYRLNVGAHKNADPKWLVPFLCRRGGVEKAAIGKIRVLPRETHVEILANAVSHFASQVAKPAPADDKDRNIKLAPLD